MGPSKRMHRVISAQDACIHWATGDLQCTISKSLIV